MLTQVNKDTLYRIYSRLPRPGHLVCRAREFAQFEKCKQNPPQRGRTSSAANRVRRCQIVKWLFSKSFLYIRAAENLVFCFETLGFYHSSGEQKCGRRKTIIRASARTRSPQGICHLLLRLKRPHKKRRTIPMQSCARSAARHTTKVTRTTSAARSRTSCGHGRSFSCNRESGESSFIQCRSRESYDRGVP
jgi:hypothetical protein